MLMANETEFVKLTACAASIALGAARTSAGPKLRMASATRKLNELRYEPSNALFLPYFPGYGSAP